MLSEESRSDDRDESINFSVVDKKGKAFNNSKQSEKLRKNKFGSTKRMVVAKKGKINKVRDR